MERGWTEVRRLMLVERIPCVTYVQELGDPSVTVYCSPQVEDMLGYPPEVYKKDPEHWIKVLHPDDRARVLAEDIRVSSTGGPFETEYRCIARDSRTVWVYDKASVTRDEEGRPRFREGVMFDITGRKALEEQLRHQAFHDPLTNLPNRALFMDRLEHALARMERRGGAIAVLFMDLDNFKPINDTFGHRVGDRLLVAVAGRVRNCLRPEDTLARLGGDEFTVLVEGVEDSEDAVRVTERIIGAFRESFISDGRELSVSASIGTALGTAPAKSPEDLLRDADLALYEAKRKGKAGYEIFRVATGASGTGQRPESGP